MTKIKDLLLKAYYIAFARRHNFKASLAFRSKKANMVSYCKGYGTGYSKRLGKWIERQDDDMYLYNKVIAKCNRTLSSRLWRLFNATCKKP